MFFKNFKNDRFINNKLFYSINIFFGGILGSYFGSQFLLKIAITENYDDKFIKFENFHQIYNLIDKTNKPIFMVYYTPFDRYWNSLRKAIVNYMDKNKNNNIPVHFCLVNKRIHFENLRNKEYKNNTNSELILPKKSIMNEDNNEEFEYIKIKFDKTNTINGISSFVEENLFNRYKFISDFWDNN